MVSVGSARGFQAPTKLCGPYVLREARNTAGEAPALPELR
jgi:hypothetical protein